MARLGSGFDICGEKLGCGPHATVFCQSVRSDDLIRTRLSKTLGGRAWENLEDRLKNMSKDKAESEVGNLIMFVHAKYFGWFPRVFEFSCQLDSSKNTRVFRFHVLISFLLHALTWIILCILNQYLPTMAPGLLSGNFVYIITLRPSRWRKRWVKITRAVVSVP